MGLRQLEIEDFLELSLKHPILDVRSPSEYEQAHIPNAINFPLFSDEERAVVGTLYKQSSREAAIRKGLEYFGVKTNQLLDRTVHILRKGNYDQTPIFLVHCWRGGMRSAGIGWLLDLYGYDVVTLKGGYKSFRLWVLNQFEKPRKFRCLGGYTGSAKTEILSILKEKYNDNVIDLEKLASHKGSAFGGIGQKKQPSQEMFENLLAFELYRCKNVHYGDERHIWIEDESQRIGTVNIPRAIWEQMKSKELIFLDIPFINRLRYILKSYGQLDRSLLVAAISRLQKKMGGLETKTAITNLLEGETQKSFEILLTYYDKLYVKALDKKKDSLERLHTLQYPTVDPEAISDVLLNKL